MKNTKGTLSIQNLSVVYKDPKTNHATSALKNISLDIKKGEFVSIVGPSGCGKTTLLYCLCGLIKPEKGDILYNGRKSNHQRNHTAIVFQDHSLFPWRNVFNNIVYGIEMQGKPREYIKKIGNELVSLVGLKGFETFYPYQLSGGMQQRVNLARALAMDPETLLLDEPFANLDAQTRELMQAELLKIWQQRRKRAIFVTHQITEAIYLSDRVVVMTKRPGSIKEIIDIPMRRPRDLKIKLSDAFKKIEKHIWKLIMKEVKIE